MPRRARKDSRNLRRLPVGEFKYEIAVRDLRGLMETTDLEMASFARLVNEYGASLLLSKIEFLVTGQAAIWSLAVYHKIEHYPAAPEEMARTDG